MSKINICYVPKSQINTSKHFQVFLSFVSSRQLQMLWFCFLVTNETCKGERRRNENISLPPSVSLPTWLRWEAAAPPPLVPPSPSVPQLYPLSLSLHLWYLMWLLLLCRSRSSQESERSVLEQGCSFQAVFRWGAIGSCNSKSTVSQIHSKVCCLGFLNFRFQ